MNERADLRELGVEIWQYLASRPRTLRASVSDIKTKRILAVGIPASLSSMHLPVLADHDCRHRTSHSAEGGAEGAAQDPRVAGSLDVP